MRNNLHEFVFFLEIHAKQPLEEYQLKNYLIDTFNIAFGYPECSPWSIDDLQRRFESIHELLSPRDPRLDTTDTIFRELVSSCHSTTRTSSTATNSSPDMFQKAAMAFELAKKNFSRLNNDQYSWSDGDCTWVENIETGDNERRHDDILTYDYREGRMSNSFSIIITCIATLTDGGNLITLSIGSTVNGKVCRVPIGRYSRTQNIAADVQKNFSIELNNLMKSIAKERRSTASQ